MKKILVWCLLLSFGLLLCGCKKSVPSIQTLPPKITASTQPTVVTTCPEQEETTTPTTIRETVPAATEPPATEAPQVAQWKTAYLKYLKKVKDEYTEFALVYIDGDDIPELYLSGCCEAVGDMVCAYKNGKVLEQRLNRTYGGSYIPKSGMFINTNGNMGYYTTDIYKLTGKSFKQLWSGFEVEEIVNRDEAAEEWDAVYYYYIDDKEVSEAEYYAAIHAIFDLDQAVELFENAVSYKAIQNQISDHEMIP